MKIVSITDAAGQIVAPEWLPGVEAVHRQLRPKLPGNYAERMKRVFADGGRLIAAVLNDKVAGVALYRIYETTFDGRRLYVDDLVIDEAQRSTGVGHAMLAHLEALGQHEGCDMLALESGTHRQQAHKFYFREGMLITSFAFRKPIAQPERHA